MLKKKTCLLLGAGASHHLGFPLGAGLKRDMVKALETPAALLDRLPVGLENTTEDHLRAFHDELAYGAWVSPDEFLEHRRQFVDFGKLLIARLLAPHEDARAIARDAGWYERLRLALRGGSIEGLKASRLSVVTFNYDRSIDCFLHRFVQFHYQMGWGEALGFVREHIPIVHVHGMLGEYPTYDYGGNPVRSSNNSWQSIKIVSEAVDTSPEFEQASRLLNGADRVVVIGFGFGEDNVRRLRFFREQPEGEYQIDERDILIAAGYRGGWPEKLALRNWLDRWGLVDERHYWMLNTDYFFTHGIDPFA